MLRVISSRYRESQWVPISRIMDRIGNLDVIAAKELIKGLQNPEGIWGRLLKKSSDLRDEYRVLTNIELWNFRDIDFVNYYTTQKQIEQYIADVQFVTEMGIGRDIAKSRWGLL